MGSFCKSSSINEHQYQLNIELSKSSYYNADVIIMLLFIFCRMRYVAAYLLAALGGNENPSTKDIKAILESVGVGYDDERANLIVKQLQGKSINEVKLLCFLFL